MIDDLPRSKPRYNVCWTFNALGPVPEADVYADSGPEAIADLTRAFRELLPTNGYAPTDLIMMKGPRSDVIVFTGTLGDLIR